MKNRSNWHPLILVLSSVTWIIRRLPLAVAEGIFSFLVLLTVSCIPRYRRIALRNLSLAFPESTAQWRDLIYRESLRSLARVFIDFARLPALDRDWVETHVTCRFLERYRELKSLSPDKGVLIATGHLGSFELLAHCMPVWGHPIAFVVRNFQWRAVDAWWTASRERFGNVVVNRKGAFKEVLERLRAGQDVALLFDQNVTKNHAVFVPWFGKDAATTKTLALAVLRTGCPVVVAGIVSLPGDRYEVLAEEVDLRRYLNDASLDAEQKVNVITAELSARYEKFIRAQPGQWFWFHRRWRTRPENDPENPYEGC